VDHLKANTIAGCMVNSVRFRQLITSWRYSAKACWVVAVSCNAWMVVLAGDDVSLAFTWRESWRYDGILGSGCRSVVRSVLKPVKLMPTQKQWLRH